MRLLDRVASETEKRQGPLIIFYTCVLQIQTLIFPKTGAMIGIAINGKTGDNGSLVAVQGYRESSAYRALMVTGTIVLKSGWKASIKVFTRDKKNFLAKSGSGFSCHFLRTLARCTTKQTTNALAQQVFTFVNNDMNNNTNSTTHAERNVHVLPSEDAVGYPFRAADGEEFVGAATGISHNFLFVCTVMSLVMQIH